MNIVLTGFMATGKTVVGKLLAEKIGFQYIGTDELIEKQTNMKISEIFAVYGEPYFRDIETEIVRKVSEFDNYVIATGGGVVLRKENMDLLEKNGIIINLTASPDKIYERAKNSNERPLLNIPDPKSEIIRLLNMREPYYKRCNFRINTDNLSVEEVVNECLKYIEKKL